MKRILILLFATLLAGQVLAYDFKNGDLYYNITSSTEPYTVEVTYQYDWGANEENYSGVNSVIVPSTVTDGGITYSVTGIGMYAFYRCNTLTEITIPNSITRISRGAFLSCENLQFKEYDNAYYLGTEDNDYYWLIGVKNIEKTSYVINDNCKVICDEVFNCCSNLTTVTIGKSVVIIGSSAFSQCFNLKSISIPGTVKKIDGNAFYQCSSITSLTIPNSVNEIGYGAFETVKNIIYGGTAKGAPWGALNINGVPDTEGFLYADDEKTQLTAYVGNGGDVVIPNTVTSIGDRAFNGCTTLLSVTIPTTIESVGEGVFDGCNNLQYKEYDNAKYLGNAENPYLCLVKAKDNVITKCEINNNCKIICGGAFIGCGDLIMINVPNSVAYIGNYAFGWCSNIVVTIPESVIRIEGGAFFCYGATLYCQAASKLDGWQDGWNSGNDVVWSCKVVNVNVNNAKFGNVSTAGSYTIKADDGSLWYLNETVNKSVTLSATANEGCHFVGWNDDNTSATRTIAVTESGNYTAEFSINTYMVSTSAENGLVVGAGTYTHGKRVTLIATPSIGYQFLCWNDTVTANPRILTVTSDSSFTAVFEPKNVTDTIKIEVIKTDTIYLTKTDTLIYYKDVKFVYDTIEKEVFVHDTVIYYKDVKFVHDTVVNTILDTVINTIHDIIENKIFIHDTIYITKTDTIYLQTSVSNAQAIGLSIYPNPTASFVMITGEGVFGYVLTNTNGKVLRKEEDATSYVVDLSEYADGIYLLRTSDGVTHKIVKQ